MGQAQNQEFKKKEYVLAMLNLRLLDIQDFHDAKQYSDGYTDLKV